MAKKKTVSPLAAYRAVARRPKLYTGASRLDVPATLRALGAGWQFERESARKSGKTVGYARPVWISPTGAVHRSVAAAMRAAQQP